METYFIVIAATAGLAVLLTGFLIGALEASIWLACAIIGQAAALQLIDAGTTVHYQHLRSLTQLLSGEFRLLLVLVGLQAVATGMRLFTLRNRLGSLWRGTLRLWQWCILALILAGTSATLSRDVRFYSTELMMATAIQLVNLATVALFALTIPENILESIRTRLAPIFPGKTRTAIPMRRRLDSFVIGCLFWTLGISLILACVVYERHPHIPDEVSYLYQARYFAEGELTMPSPPVPAAFDLDLLMYEPNRWYSPVPPGWGAILALGALFGIPWLVNPLLAGINVFLTSIFVEDLYDRRTARLACLLLCVSPWHLFMAMNFMTHTALFTCMLIAAIAVQRMRKTGNAWWGVLGGLALGLTSLIRPLDAFTIAIALGVWSLGARGRSFRFAPTVVLTLVTMFSSAVQLVYNAFVSGTAMTFPITKYCDLLYGPGSNDLGFGPNRGLGWGLDPFPGHGLRDVIVNANLNVTAINVELFGWAAGSLILIGVLIVSRSMGRKEYGLAAVIALVIAMQSLYWFSGGPDFGARYWYPVLLPCILLSIRGFDWLTRGSGFTAAAGLNGTRIAVGFGALILVALVTFFPWRAGDKYFRFRGMRPEVRTLSVDKSFGRSVVFIRGKRHPDYASAAIYNPLDLKANAPIFVWDRDLTVREQVLMEYPDRPVWFVDGPTVTGRGFEIAGGPLDKEEAGHFPLSQLALHKN